MINEPMAGGQDTTNGCTVDTFQKVCITANVTVTPKVQCGEASVSCLKPARIVTGDTPPCPGGTLSPTGSCSFTIAQELCIKVPVQFEAQTECEKGETFCFPASATACDLPG